MMDLIELSGTAVAVATPYLAKAVDGAAEKLGENALEAAGKLVGWLRAKLSPPGTQALAALATQPSSTVKQDILKLHIQDFLQDNPALVEELRALVTSPHVQTIIQNQNVSGTNNKAAQVAGNNNSVTIG